MFKPFQFKLYPSLSQERTLTEWLRSACWVYNQALEHRIKAYRRRKDSPTLYSQDKMLTGWRRRMERLRAVPRDFLCGALRRVDYGMKAFFRRCKAGEKPGFPRFRAQRRYNSIEIMRGRGPLYISDRAIRIQHLGCVKARGRFGVEGRQRGLRIVRRASGWYAQVILEVPVAKPLAPTGEDCGIDLGLESFLTTDSGEQVGNPRILLRAAKKMRVAKQRLSRCQRGSMRREKAKRRVARAYELLARRRRGFCHCVSRKIINRYDRIAVEKLNVKGLARGRFAKSIQDAAWGIFLAQLRYKAESAGRVVVEVNPCGTSRECPACGAVARKELSEREHNCPCGLRCHRDHAAAQVIRQRAFGPVRGGPVSPAASALAGPVKREGYLFDL